MATLSEKLTELAQSHYGKWENLSQQKKEKLLMVVMGIAFANLLYSLLGLYIILSIVLMLGSVYVFAKIRLQAMMERGLITYLPKKTQRKLLERSLFDLLCDAWFIPRLGKVIKTIMRPFFVAVNPEDAVYQLDDLPEPSKQLFLQKVKYFSISKCAYLT